MILINFIIKFHKQAVVHRHSLELLRTIIEFIFPLINKLIWNLNVCCRRVAHSSCCRDSASCLVKPDEFKWTNLQAACPLSMLALLISAGQPTNLLVGKRFLPFCRPSGTSLLACLVNSDLMIMWPGKWAFVGINYSSVIVYRFSPLVTLPCFVTHRLSARRQVPRRADTVRVPWSVFPISPVHHLAFPPPALHSSPSSFKTLRTQSCQHRSRWWSAVTADLFLGD